MRPKPSLWFTAEFQCSCLSMIVVENFAAVIDGPGMEMACRHCKQRYTITRTGAVPITERDK